MDPHERFMKHRTTEVVRFLIDTSKNMICTFIKEFKKVLQKQYTFIDSLLDLETVRTILCSFYQRKFNSLILDDTWSAKLDQQISLYPFDLIKVSEIQEILYTQLSTESFQDWVELSLVLDILVLHMFLFCDETAIWIHLEKLQDLIHSHLVEKKKIELLDIKLMNCYMHSLLLHQRKSQSTEKSKGERVSALFLKNVQIWLTLKDHNECQLLTQCLPRLMKLIPDCGIVRKIWQMIFKLKNDPGITLSILCQTANVWFPMESDCDKALIDQSMEEPFWLLLLKGVSNPILQHRKQAVHLIKRVVRFADKHKTQGFELDSYREIRPLICIGTDSEQDSFNKNLNNFFLILEASEKKQKHLVENDFPLIKTLLNETFDPKNHETGLHSTWIRCALMRILQHDNKDIVKWGLQIVLTVDLELYNDEFLSMVLDVLNNTYLYEYHVNQEEPTVVKGLTELLNSAETKGSDLVARFIIKASQMTWDPVALFYIIHALSMLKKVGSVWKEIELNAVKSLAEIISSMHCRILRIGAQIELLEALIHFATESLDLVVVANTLSVFSTSEVLIRGQLSWKRVSVWLSKIVKEEEALTFLEEFSGEFTNDNFQEDISMKSFSLMIMLFHDGHLILDSKLCPGLAVLHNLLQCLIGAESRPYAYAELRTKSIELINHLLSFTTSKDHVLCKLISNYMAVTLQLTFKNLRNVSDNTVVDNINTYVSVTQQIFTAEASIIARREILNHIEKFEAESWNIIDDGEFSHNVQRYFGIKILCACLKVTTTKLKNYKFIGPLHNAYKIPMMPSSEDAKEARETCNENVNLKVKIAAVYYKLVAELFYEYLKDNLANDWISDIDWIKEVLYLIQVGGKDVFVPLVGILSQIFYKEAVKATDIDNFKSAIRLCWSSTLQFYECRLAVEEMIDLIFSSPFLDCKETKELTIEFTHEMVEKLDSIPGLSVILAKGLKQVKGEYLSNFYEAVIACLLHGTVFSRDMKVELQARSYILDCYQEVYPNHLSDMNVNTNAATRAHSVTLLHRMITDDPTHAVKLFPRIMKKLDEIQNAPCCVEDSSSSCCHRNRIMQVLLVLQPILENGDIESLHTLICNNILPDSGPSIIRLMQEWLLIRIYLESEPLRPKIWDLFDQVQQKRGDSLCSVVSVVYHVARLLSSNLQLDFINLAFEYIMPCCMAQESNVRLHAQVIASKLYDLATKMSYPTITEKYKELHSALTKSLKHVNVMDNSIKLQDEFYLTVFNPIEDYSLQTLFYELPRVSNIFPDEYVLPQVFDKFGFKESNSHPLKLLNLSSDMSEARV